ncbi:condensation domain-containing protein, partial [Methylobacterium aquaticum]
GLLGRDHVGRHDDFFTLGGDSIVALQVVGRARRAGLLLEPRDLFRHRTLAALAAAARPIAEDRPAPEALPETGPLPLLPIQAAFLGQPVPERHHWNQALLLVPHALPGWTIVAKALDALVAHHPALRQRFIEGPDGWHTETLPHVPDPDRLWLRPAPDDDTLASHCAQAQASLDLGQGRLLRGLGLDRPDGSRRLLLAIHHLAVDGVSWRILIDDLATACDHIARGEPVILPPATPPGSWARRLLACAGSRALAAELDHWRSLDDDAAARLPG